MTVRPVVTSLHLRHTRPVLVPVPLSQVFVSTLALRLRQTAAAHRLHAAV